MAAHRPAAIWLVAAAGLSATLALAPASVGASQARAACANADSPTRQISQGEARRAVTCLVNRRRAGQRKLRLHRKLNRPALKHSRKMLEHRCLLHVCPGEPSSIERRLRKYLAGGAAVRFAEVIARNLAGASPRDVVRQWMTSPAHRRLLLGRFEHLGVGVATGGLFTYYTVELGAKN